MVVDSCDVFTTARIYPHAYRVVTIDTAGDEITVTIDKRVRWNQMEFSRESADKYLEDMRKAFDVAFNLVGK